MINLHKNRILKIFTFYWDCPCKYKVGKDWVRGRVGASTIKPIERGECVLLLKPLLMLTGSDITRMNSIIAKLEQEEEQHGASEDGEEDKYRPIADNVEVREPYTKEEVRELREHYIDCINSAPFPVVDFLRKEGFHVPVYGIDLFRTKLAEWYQPQKNIARNKKSTDEQKDR